MIKLKNNSKTDSEYAIEVNDIDKTFWIPDEKVSSFKGYFLQPWKLFRKQGKKFDALQDISFKINKGEFVGIIGRNGSGKSTLLKILAGIYAPDKGEVEVNGKLVPFLELGVGFNLELSARENIFLNGTILGMSRKFLERKEEEILNFAEVKKFADTPIKNFSSGMTVRLAFSIAIQASADIYLLDEVLAVGDSNFQRKCLDVFKRLKQEGKTVLLVSHSESSISEYADRAILLEDSRVAADGSVGSVIAKYNTNMVPQTQPQSTKTVDKKKERVTELITRSQNRWGNFMIEIKEVMYSNEKKSFEAGQPIEGKIRLQVNDKKLKKELHNVVFSFALYDARDSLICIDKYIIKDERNDQVEIDFSILIPSLNAGLYRISIDLSHKDKDKNGLVYDHWDKDNGFMIENDRSVNPGVFYSDSFFHKNVGIMGMTLVRNESLILQDTLDHMSKIVDKIIVYDDASTDDSLSIARKHPNVVEVIERKVWKSNRHDLETVDRQKLLNHAQRYNPIWLFYFDADERFDPGIRGFLKSEESKGVDGVRIRLYDAYITKEDQEAYQGGSELYGFRKMFGEEYRDILMVWRNNPKIKFEGMVAREPSVSGKIIDKFNCQHYGKSLSIEHWDETCRFYMTYPEPYHTKWKERLGKAIHSKSDFGGALYGWEEVKTRGVELKDGYYKS